MISDAGYACVRRRRILFARGLYFVFSSFCFVEFCVSLYSRYLSAATIASSVGVSQRRLRHCTCIFTLMGPLPRPSLISRMVLSFPEICFLVQRSAMLMVFHKTETMLLQCFALSSLANSNGTDLGRNLGMTGSGWGWSRSHLGAQSATMRSFSSSMPMLQICVSSSYSNFKNGDIFVHDPISTELRRGSCVRVL